MIEDLASNKPKIYIRETNSEQNGLRLLQYLRKIDRCMVEILEVPSDRMDYPHSFTVMRLTQQKSDRMDARGPTPCGIEPYYR